MSKQETNFSFYNWTSCQSFPVSNNVRVLQTIKMKLLFLFVWVKLIKTALIFKYEI